MQTFNAFRIHEIDKNIVARFDAITLDDLAAGEVVIRICYSTINYKDALAGTGASRILRRYPLVGGIDLAGRVESSSDARFTPGDEVLVTGCGLSETHDGGYAQYARVKAEWVIPIPKGLSLADSMRIGTAGFTAALGIHRMEQNGQNPGQGPIVVTGASGGVGSLAIDMLSSRGYEVVAVSGKPTADEFLKGIGAARVLRRQDLDFGKRPLETVQWAGAIDNLGGDYLTWLLRTVGFWGNIACIGLAASADLNATVMPMILRGVSLIGVNSVANPREQRIQIWQRIATDLMPRHLERIAHRTIGLDDLPAVLPDYMAANVLGRVLVKID